MFNKIAKNFFYLEAYINFASGLAMIAKPMSVTESLLGSNAVILYFLLIIPIGKIPVPEPTSSKFNLFLPKIKALIFLQYLNSRLAKFLGHTLLKISWITLIIILK